MPFFQNDYDLYIIHAELNIIVIQLMQNQQLSPNQLPIFAHLPNIIRAIHDHPVVVVSGKTGCGKSTQVPKAIWKADPSVRIAVCQPRRVAATSLAVRVAEEMGCRLGSKVGYHIGLQSFRSQNCAIVYMTYGILIQQLLFNEALDYTHIVLDEIHERSLQMDFTFVALKNIINNCIQQAKKSPKLIIMSATLNSSEFSTFFSTDPKDNSFFLPKVARAADPQDEERPNRRGTRRGRTTVKENFRLSEMPGNFRAAKTYDIPDGTQFRIEEQFWAGDNLYESSQQEPRLNDNIVNEAIKIVKSLQSQKDKGDFLIFLPGFYEIQLMKRRLIEAQFDEVRIVEVHSVFSEELYDKLFESKIINKLILATNIGESSITLPFCKVVIDFCLTKRNTLRNKGISQLETKFASKASMIQRAGRVGRVADGYVFRMIPKDLYEKLPQYEEPEIKGITLQMVILKAKQLDLINRSKVFADPYHFLLGVMDPPEVGRIREAIQRLLEEQALLGVGPGIDAAHTLQLSKIGQFMVSMPCDIQISKMIMMGIKLRIPSLIIAVASIMMATKMFFAHEERRSNIEQFLHALIGYDNGLGNDFLLRERIYNHWKEKFYYPAKQKKVFSKWAKHSGHVQQESSREKRVYEIRLEQQQDELFTFLQEFTQERWTQRQKDFCFPRGINLNAMRQIVRIEQNLRVRIANMGVSLEQQQKHSICLFMLCLAYAFPANDCEILFNKRMNSYRGNLSSIELPGDWKVSHKELEDYIYPERQFRIEAKLDEIIVEGSPSVLKKFAFPQYFHRNSINKYVSPLFEKLAKSKFLSKFDCEVIHKGTIATVLNQSINRVLIPHDYFNTYKLLTNQLTIVGNRKMVKISALIKQEAYLLMQLITGKQVWVALHPSRQMLSSFKVGERVYEFRRIMGWKELEAIKRVRSGATRKNSNEIQCSQQVMCVEDIETLAGFLQSKDIMPLQRQPWQQIFIKQQYGQFRQQFRELSYPFQFAKDRNYFSRYLEWKRNRYYSFIDNYRQLILNEVYLICSQCPHIEPIQRVYMYDPSSALLHLNQYSGSWEIHRNDLICTEGHHVGALKSNEQAALVAQNLNIYTPCKGVEPFWAQWPSKEEIAEMNEQAKRAVDRIREEIEYFQCPFCFEKDEDHRPLVLKGRFGHLPLWKKLQSHFGSHQHLEALTQFRKSLRHK